MAKTGIFKKHGFNVTYKSVNKSSERLAAMATGHVEFGSVGQIAMLIALANGNDTFYWVGTQNMAKGFEGLAGGPGIKSFADLKGKKIGVPLALTLAPDGVIAISPWRKPWEQA